jgi:CheY-like chemotaxis protein/anti-sigma regulatory factor (Ser/Thr protein kinase)
VHDRVPPDLPPLASDRDKCRHILQNVIANAVKFTEKGEVIISGSSEPRTSRDPRPSVRITVADTGIGILPEELPHIFEDFRQGDESTTRKYGGSGLGLAIARRYALLLGGGISADSQPGKGSTFTITLPQVLEAQASGRSPSLSSATSAPAARGHAVLVVEDNELSIVQLSDILGSEGYRVRVARNGREALAQLAQDLPSAVILDLIMPEVDGFEILRSIRAVKRTARLPVVVLTAKHVTSGELSVLEGNHVFQLIRKGDIDRSGLLDAVAKMVSRGDTGE